MKRSNRVLPVSSSSSEDDEHIVSDDWDMYCPHSAFCVCGGCKACEVCQFVLDWQIRDRLITDDLAAMLTWLGMWPLVHNKDCCATDALWALDQLERLHRHHPQPTQVFEQACETQAKQVTAPMTASDLLDWWVYYYNNNNTKNKLYKQGSADDM